MKSTRGKSAGFLLLYSVLQNDTPGLCLRYCMLGSKKHTDLVSSSDMNLALNSGQSLSESSAMVNLNIATSFAGNGALGAELLTLKVQSCAHVHPSVQFIYFKIPQLLTKIL